MTPKKLVLKHMFQHTFREIVFTRGMNSLVGPNGSGKSNILHALCFALTGESPLPGKRTDMVQNGYERGEIVLEFEHLATPGVVKVALRRNYTCIWDEQRAKIDQAKMLVARAADDASVEITQEVLKLTEFVPREHVQFTMTWGDQTCRNVSEYQEWLQTYLGVPPKVLVSSYFPCQGDIDSMIADDGEHRRRVLYEKANVGLCSFIWQTLGKHINAMPDTSLLDTQAEQIRQDLAHAEQRYASVQQLLDEHPVPSVSLESLLKTQHELQTYVADMSQKTSLLKNLETLQASIDRLTTEQETLCKQGKELRSMVDALQESYEHATTLLSQYAVYQKHEQRRQELQHKIDALRASAAEDPSIPDPPSDEDVQSLITRIHACEQEIQRLSKFLSTFESGICPTCGSRVSDPDKLHAMRCDLQAKQLELKQLIPERHRKEQLRREWQAKHKQIEAARASRDALLCKYEGELAGLAVLASESFTSERIEQAHNVVKQYTAVDTELQECRAAYANVTSQLQSALASQRVLEQQLSLLNTKCVHVSQSLSYDEAVQQLRDVSQTIDTLRATLDRRRALETECAILESRVADLRQRYADIEKQLRMAQRLRSLKQILQETRELFHEDALPAQVAAWYAHQLMTHAADYLKTFDVSFTIAMTSDFRCVALFPGKVIPVSRLSGGEKNILNICIRLAMTDLFPTDLKLLILDEVEVHLDATNASRLPMLLERVKAVGRSRDLVVIFVSHHPSLRDVSDHIVSLAA